MRRGVRALRRVAVGLLVGSSFIATAQAAAPKAAPAASRRQVADSLRALAAATGGIARAILPGGRGTLEEAIVRFAPVFPNRVREGQAPPARPGAKCRPEMALVADRVCVDRYEASLVEVLPGGVLKAQSPYLEPVAGHVYIARSVPDVVPQAHINGPQALAACRAAKKRLCEPVEWRAACGGSQGYAYPYGKDRVAGACNDSGKPSVAIIHSSQKGKRGWGNTELNDPRLNQYPNTLAPAGSSYACVNDYGLWDMVGNLHEWTADPNGTFQGGYYLDTSQHGEGCAYRTIAHDFDYHDYSIGFRCCADPDN